MTSEMIMQEQIQTQYVLTLSNAFTMKASDVHLSVFLLTTMLKDSTQRR
jgi:hypothetical protein